MSNINAKFLLRIDTYENWTKAPGMNKVLDPGEIGLCEILAGSNEATTAPTVLFKVGDGTHKFHELNWASALAADVHAWAKESALFVAEDTENAEGANVISEIVWDETLNGGKGGLLIKKVSVATSEGFGTLSTTVEAIQKDIADNRDAWAKDDNTQYTFAQSEDGKTVTITTNDGNTGATLTFAYLTDAEVGAKITTALANYYTKTETDAEVKKATDAAAAAQKTADDYIHDHAADYDNNTIDTKVQGALDKAGNVQIALNEYKTEVGNTYETKEDATAKLGEAKTYAEGQAGAVENKLNTYKEEVAGTVATLETKEDAAAKLAEAKKYADDKIDAIPEVVHPEYTIVKDENAGDYAAVYHLTKDGENVGAAINIPKDMVVKSGSVVNDEIILVLNDEAQTEIKIPVGGLIEYVTSGSQTGDMVFVTVDETTHKVTATITDGTITKAKLAADVQASLGKADTALQEHQSIAHLATKEELNGLKNTEVKANTDAIAKLNGGVDEEGSVAKTAKDAADKAITDANLGQYAKDADIKTIAKTGSIYDANEASAITIDDKTVKYFVFNGGSATSEW